MKTNKKIYKDNQYTLSIDPGLNNVGWALFDEENKKWSRWVSESLNLLKKLRYLG